MKKIGFVDYYISEWHANNYPGWIKNICEQKGYDYKLSYVWAEKDISPVDGRSTNQWCEAYGAEKCETIEELCEKCDVIFILAPSNEEKHLPYAEKVFPFAKPTYVDKTFAECYESGAKIFELAEKYGTPFFSSSALRYSDAFDGYDDPRNMTISIAGASVAEYIIHAVEQLVKKLGTGAVTVTCIPNGRERYFFVRYPDERSATVIFANFVWPDVTTVQRRDNSAKSVAGTVRVFDGLIADILRFFEEGTVSFDTAQTLEAMKLRDAMVKANRGENLGVTLEV